MKKTFITRLLAIVLCMAMLATVTPIVAIAETTIDKMVYEANLDYDDFFYMMDFKLELSVYSGTTDFGHDIVWTDITEVRRTDDPTKPLDEWVDLYNEDVNSFEKGYTYKVLMSATLSESYIFDEGLSIESIAGNPSVFEWGGNNTQVFFWVDVNLSDPPASKPLTVSVEMNSIPYGGDIISDVGNDFTMTCNADEADILSRYFGFCAVSDDPFAPIDDWELCGDSDKFEAGRSYAFCYVIALDSYVYNAKTVLDTATITINGKEPDMVDLNSGGGTYVRMYVVFPNIEGLPEMPYNLIVGDTIVTADNASDIFGDGTAAYDSATNTLTIDNADITTSYEWHTQAHNYSSIFANGDLNLVVKGDNKITSEATDANFIDAIHVNGNLTVSGDGGLTVVGGKSNGTVALYSNGSVTIFAEGDYSFVGDVFGAMVYDLLLCPNTIGATVTFEGTNGQSMLCNANADYYDFDIVGDGETILYFDQSKKNLTFTAVANTDYGLTVGDVTVDETNKNDIFGDGTASYDPDAKTLTLNNATIDTWSRVNGWSDAICSKKPLTVVLVGDNVIDMTFAEYTENGYGAAIESYWDVTVTGDGNLTLKDDKIADNFDLTGIYACYNLDFQIDGDFTMDAGVKSGNEISVLYAGNRSVTYSAKNTSISIGDVYYANLFYGYHDVSIKNIDNFTLTTGETTNGTEMVYAIQGKVFIENSGTMTMTSGKSQTVNYGFSCGDCIILNDGDFTLDIGDANDTAYGIGCRDLSVVSGKALTLKTGNSDMGGSQTLNATGMATFMCSGTVNVEAGSGYDQLYALMANDILLTGDAKYTFTTGDSSDFCTDGLYAYNSVRIADEADVTVNIGLTNGYGYYSYAISGTEVVITDAATVDVTAAGAPNGAVFGVQGHWSTEISTYGNVSVKAGDESDVSVGIISNDVTISGTGEGNSIYVEGKDGAFSSLPTFSENAYAITGAKGDETELKEIDIEDFLAYAKVKLTASNTEPSETEPTETESTGTEPTGTEPTGTEPTGTEPTSVEPTGTEPTSVEPTGTEVEPTGTGTEPEELLGDANGDGAVNMKDVLTLRKYLAGMDVSYNASEADVNGDGDVNMKDVLMLRKFLAGLITEL